MHVFDTALSCVRMFSVAFVNWRPAQDPSAGRSSGNVTPPFDWMDRSVGQRISARSIVREDGLLGDDCHILSCSADRSIDAKHTHAGTLDSA